MADLETWVTDGLTVVSTAVCAIPLVGPVIGAAGFGLNALTQIFWPKQKVDLMAQAIQNANSSLSLPTSVDLGTWGSLLDALSMESVQAQGATTSDAAIRVVNEYYDDLRQAMDDGDSSKLPAQLKVLSTTILNNQTTAWRQRVQILSIYALGANVELQVLAQLVSLNPSYDSTLSSYRASAWLSRLLTRVDFHVGNVEPVINQINNDVLAEMKDTAGDAYKIFMMPYMAGSFPFRTQVGAPTDPVSEAAALTDNLELSMKISVPGMTSMSLLDSISSDIKTAINALADAQNTVAHWNQTASEWKAA
jgi:hypothetical protein